jgi:methylated-DNA-[protein]-cysteine S-methyltransferase
MKTQHRQPSMSAVRCATLDTPLGPLMVAASDRGLRGLWFDGQRHFAGRAPEWVIDQADAMIRAAMAQLGAYFAGSLRVFDLPLDPLGTSFQRAVWNAISRVPYGATQSYSALAQCAGAAGSARAAGAATGRNPLSIVVPCHRIVGAQGALTGYAGGLDRKRALLAIERGEPTLFPAEPHVDELQPA